MKKFNVVFDIKEVKKSDVLNFGVEDAYFNSMPPDFIYSEIFDSLEEARRVMNSFYPKIKTEDFGKLCRISIAYIESGEYEYDEDLESWEWVDGCDIEDIIYEELPEEEEEEEEDED